jgi:hypothetical protein
MKQSYFRLLIPVLFLILCTGVVAGCSGDKAKQVSPAPSSAAPAQNQAKNPPPNQKAPDGKAAISSLIDKGKEIKEMTYDLVMTGAGLSSQSIRQFPMPWQ